jgi:membrane protease subunit HflC
MKISILVIAIIALVTFFNSTYTIDEGRQAIITQFGKPVGDPITEAGLHFKKPFVQNVTYVDKRILTWDGYPNQIPTKDKKYISVDTTARWQIIDALKFIQTVQNARGAKARLDSIIDANTRNAISDHNLVEAVRNSNAILDAQKDKVVVKGEVDDDIKIKLEIIKLGREKLSQIIAQKSDKEVRSFGIQIIDVQLRRISYEKSVEKKVYERMISERQRIAEKIRSIGLGEKAKIEGRLNKDLQTIKSRAYKTSEIIKGRGQAKAYNIYAKALSKGPEFYEYIRTLEAYKKTIKEDATLIVTQDGGFLRYFKKK